MTATYTGIHGEHDHIEYVLVRLSVRRWAIVTDYGQTTHGCRSGCWAADAMGGWGIHSTDPIKAVCNTVRPKTYPTRRDALAILKG